MKRCCENCVNNEGYEEKVYCETMLKPPKEKWCWASAESQLKQERERYTYVYQKFFSVSKIFTPHQRRMIGEIRNCITALERKLRL